jgi:uncharacterized PurR-regulated membrane protein YhhQ (DUF165 family)
MVISFLGVLGAYIEGSVWDIYIYNLIVKLKRGKILNLASPFSLLMANRMKTSEEPRLSNP